MSLRLLHLFTCLAGLWLSGPVHGAQGEAEAKAAAQLGPGIAATAGKQTLSWQELNQLLLDRFAGSETGRAALAHLVRSEMLVRLEEETGLAITQADVDARWNQVAESLRGTGQSIEAQLEQNGLSAPEFRRYLRLSIVHETLTRRALGLPDGEPVTGEQQEMWLDQTLAERGCAELPIAWAEPGSAAHESVVVARCAGVEVTLAEYLPHLRRALAPEELRRACYQLLLDKRMVQLMPDLASKAVEAAVATEVERRRREAESDPKHQGISFEQLLEAQGVRPASLARDPVIRVTALSKLFIERSYDEEGLRGVYANERDFFDGTYGEAVEVGLIFLRAARFPNEIIKRSFADAEKELAELAQQARTFQEFQRLAARTSDAPGARQDRGLLGYVTRLDERLDEALRAAVFEGLARRTSLDPPAEERIVGPLRVASRLRADVARRTPRRAALGAHGAPRTHGAAQAPGRGRGAARGERRDLDGPGVTHADRKGRRERRRDAQGREARAHQAARGAGARPPERAARAVRGGRRLGRRGARGHGALRLGLERAPDDADRGSPVRRGHHGRGRLVGPGRRQRLREVGLRCTSRA